MQTTAHLLMVRPVNFEFNAQTAVNNAFQVRPADTLAVREKALAEFDGMVAMLRENGISVTVTNDTTGKPVPDAVFPNNWVSFHSDGTIVLYPMFAVNRRLERDPAIIGEVVQQFSSSGLIDLSNYENEGLFLEGTGSMVLDRENKIAYACLSPRTHRKVLDVFCEKMGYTAVSFDAVDIHGQSIYHTNVMMSVASQYVVICLEAIRRQEQQKKVLGAINQSGKTVMAISYDQLNNFAGNLLQVHNSNGEKIAVMSARALQSFPAAQLEQLRQFNKIISAPLTEIEQNGGGSARCMMAEIHLPPLVTV
jgi:hypothetical protein